MNRETEIKGCANPEFNGKHEIISIKDTSEQPKEAATPPAGVPQITINPGPQRDPEEIRAQIWEQAVHPFRKKEALRKKVDIKDVVLEGDFAPTPGFKYIKFAFNRFGMPAMPKGHGRKRARLGPREMRIKRLALVIFNALYKELEEQVKKALKPDQKFAGITPEQIHELGAISAAKAAERIHEIGAGSKKAERNRQKLARRVNFGLLAGNRARPTHSAG